MGRKKGMGSAPLATGIALASLANIFAATPSMAQDSACIAGCASSIDDIIVTATRRDSSVISVPLSVAASDRERLDRDRVTNIAALARPTPGLSLINGWGASTCGRALCRDVAGPCVWSSGGAETHKKN